MLKHTIRPRFKVMKDLRYNALDLPRVKSFRKRKWRRIKLKTALPKVSKYYFFRFRYLRHVYVYKLKLKKQFKLFYNPKVTDRRFKRICKLKKNKNVSLRSVLRLNLKLDYLIQNLFFLGTLFCARFLISRGWFKINGVVVRSANFFLKHTDILTIANKKRWFIVYKNYVLKKIAGLYKYQSRLFHKLSYPLMFKNARKTAKRHKDFDLVDGRNNRFRKGRRFDAFYGKLVINYNKNFPMLFLKDINYDFVNFTSRRRKRTRKWRVQWWVGRKNKYRNILSSTRCKRYIFPKNVKKDNNTRKPARRFPKRNLRQNQKNKPVLRSKPKNVYKTLKNQLGQPVLKEISLTGSQRARKVGAKRFILKNSFYLPLKLSSEHLLKKYQAKRQKYLPSWKFKRTTPPESGFGKLLSQVKTDRKYFFLSRQSRRRGRPVKTKYYEAHRKKQWFHKKCFSRTRVTFFTENIFKYFKNRKYKNTKFYFFKKYKNNLHAVKYKHQNGLVIKTSDLFEHKKKRCFKERYVFQNNWRRLQRLSNKKKVYFLARPKRKLIKVKGFYHQAHGFNFNLQFAKENYKSIFIKYKQIDLIFKNKISPLMFEVNYNTLEYFLIEDRDFYNEPGYSKHFDYGMMCHFFKYYD